MTVTVFGSGAFRYEVVDNWAKRPTLWTFTDVVGVAVDSQDRAYVFTRSAHPVMVFDKDGNFVRSWGEGLFRRAHGIFIDAWDNVWCTDDMGHTVRKFDLSGNPLLMLGKPDVRSDTGYDGRDLYGVKRAAGPFNGPTKAIVVSSGDIYVTDGYGNACVHRFNAKGEHILSWGEPGTGPGQFILPHSLVVDRQGQVYVADRQNHRIQVFTADGQFVRMWHGVRTPMDMLIATSKSDASDNLYMAEGGNRVSVWDLNGNMLASWGGEEGRSNDAGLFMAPHGIARDSRGVLYVGEVCETGASFDRGVRAVQKFVPVR
jgi:DNA-binding beta-propeller fold protein YncE